MGEGRERLFEIAEKHGMPGPDEGLSPHIFFARCLDLMMVELGLMEAPKKSQGGSP